MPASPTQPDGYLRAQDVSDTQLVAGLDQGLTTPAAGANRLAFIRAAGERRVQGTVVPLVRMVRLASGADVVRAMPEVPAALTALTQIADTSCCAALEKIFHGGGYAPPSWHALLTLFMELDHRPDDGLLGKALSIDDGETVDLAAILAGRWQRTSCLPALRRHWDGAAGPGMAMAMAMFGDRRAKPMVERLLTEPAGTISSALRDALAGVGDHDTVVAIRRRLSSASEIEAIRLLDAVDGIGGRPAALLVAEVAATHGADAVRRHAARLLDASHPET